MALFDEYEDHDALGLAGLIRDRRTTPDELLDAALERVATRNPGVNAVIHLMEDAARETISRGLPPGPVSGVPFMLKDLHGLCAGEPTTNGSRLYQGNVADHDSTIIARYREAGLLLFAKTNTPEVGISGTTEPVLYGPTLNPWDRSRSAGGSSGGGAAAVVTGMVPVAQATDGGGSIRSPAANCGLFGLKPTRARTPAGPDAGEGWSGLATYHVVSRTVRDSAVFLDVAHGPEPGDPYTAPVPDRDFLAEVGRDPGRLRIALWTEGLCGEPVDPECVLAAERVAGRLAELGHTVTPAVPPVSGAESRRAITTILVGHTANHVTLRLNALGRALRSDDLENITRLAAEEGNRLSARDYANALVMAHRTGRQMAGFFDEYDIILSPTLADPPLPLRGLDMMGDDLDYYMDRLWGHMAFTPLYNLSGCPAASLPMRMTPDGLPVGVQIGAAFGNEAILFRLAAQLEEADPWWDRRPPPLNTED
ncbi:MAG: amidase [bacterium]|nr:amidase [bacterium]